MKKDIKADLIQQEKNKLHLKYIIVIATILLFGSIVLATSNKNEFVAQVSFGSTMTSIILSVIAIWMSISGERTTNDIKTKISDSAESLAKTGKKIKNLNKRYENTLNVQIGELKSVQEQLTQIIQSVNNVEKQVSFMHEKKLDNPNTINTNTMSSDQKITLFDNIFTWSTTLNPGQEFIFCKMTQIVISKHSNGIPFSFGEIAYSLAESNINTNYNFWFMNTCWGIINTLLAASVFDDQKVLDHISTIINNKTNLQSPSL